MNVFITDSVPSLELGRIKCPHCGLIFDGKSDSLYLTHALSPDQENTFVKNRHDIENKGKAASLDRRIEVFWGEMSASEHFVQIYDDNAAFMNTLETFIREGLLAGDAAIVIATATHLAALDDRLTANGIDVAAVRSQDRYIPLIVEDALAKFMVNGWPNDELFTSIIVDLLSRARRDGRKVRAFGEMVALLWAQGHGAATVRLEHLWGQLCDQQSFPLFCAYPRVGFTENATDSIAHVCTMHSKVITA